MKIDTSLNSPPPIPTAAELSAPIAKESKLAKACDQFEGIFVRQILQEGMKPLLAKPPGSGSTGSGIYDYMVTDTMANSVAGQNAMGISQMLQQQFAPHKSTSPHPSHP